MNYSKKSPKYSLATERLIDKRRKEIESLDIPEEEKKRVLDFFEFYLEKYGEDRMKYFESRIALQEVQSHPEKYKRIKSLIRRIKRIMGYYKKRAERDWEYVNGKASVLERIARENGIGEIINLDEKRKSNKKP